MRSGRYLHVSVHHLLISSIDSVPIARPRLLFYVGIFTVHTNRVHRVQSYIVCLTLSNSPSFVRRYVFSKLSASSSVSYSFFRCGIPHTTFPPSSHKNDVPLRRHAVCRATFFKHIQSELLPSLLASSVPSSS